MAIIKKLTGVIERMAAQDLSANEYRDENISNGGRGCHDVASRDDELIAPKSPALKRPVSQGPGSKTPGLKAPKTSKAAERAAANKEKQKAKLKEGKLPTCNRTVEAELVSDIRSDNRLAPVPGRVDFKVALLESHCAFNRGVRASGEILLTLRAGLSPDLASSTAVKAHPDMTPRELLAWRRIMIARAWFTVETPATDIKPELIVASETLRRGQVWKLEEALAAHLEEAGVPVAERNEWLDDCRNALKAEIRDDAVWVDRRKAFLDLQEKLELTEDEVWELPGSLFGSIESYLAPPKIAKEKDTDNDSTDEGKESDTSGKKGKDDGDSVSDKFAQTAKTWLTDRFPCEKATRKIDYKMLAETYGFLAEAAEEIAGTFGADETMKGSDVATLLLAKARAFAVARGAEETFPDTTDIDEFLAFTKHGVSGVRAALWICIDKESVSAKELQNFAATFQKESDSARDRREKGARPYAESIVRDLERAVGLELQPEGQRENKFKFGAMIGQAAGDINRIVNVSKGKELARFTGQREVVLERERIPQAAREWLDDFCEQHSSNPNVEPKRLGVRISQKTLNGWREVISAWTRGGAATEAERVEAVRVTQKFRRGGIGWVDLFQALAADSAVPVWRDENGKVTAEILEQYANTVQLEQKLRGTRAPVIAHADPFNSPRHMRMGEGQFLNVSYDVLERVQGVKALNEREGADDHVLRVELFDGKRLQEYPLRWRSQLLDSMVLAAAPGTAPGTVHEGDVTPIPVARNTEHGRVAGGMKIDDETPVSIPGIFDKKAWSATILMRRGSRDREKLRSIASRPGLDASERRELLAKQAARSSWKMHVSLGFLTPIGNDVSGPWARFAAEAGLPKKNSFASVHKTENDARGVGVKMKLCELPGLRLTSVVLGARHFATCAVLRSCTGAEVHEACARGGVPAPSERDLEVKIPAMGDSAARVYIRIASSQIEGVPTKAQWAQIERVRTVRLPGERDPDAKEKRIRRVTEHEAVYARRFFERVGYNPGSIIPVRFDRWMDKMLTATRRGVKRHGMYAVQAYQFNPDVSRNQSGDPDKQHERRINDLSRALSRWKGMAFNDSANPLWRTDDLREGWNTLVAPRLGLSAGEDIKEKHIDTLAAQLAEDLAGARELSHFWREAWQRNDDVWNSHIRALNRLVLRGELPNIDPAAPREVKWLFNSGGLSLWRIGMLDELHSNNRRFYNGPTPDQLYGNHSPMIYGRDLLLMRAGLAEQRRKEGAHKVLSVALGIERKDRQVDASHALVFVRSSAQQRSGNNTRSENRRVAAIAPATMESEIEQQAKMAGILFRYAQEFRDVSDAVSGAPIVRCAEVPVLALIHSAGTRYTQGVRAVERVRNANILLARDEKLPVNQRPKAVDRYLAALSERWDATTRTWRDHLGLEWVLNDDLRWIAPPEAEGRTAPRALIIPDSSGPIVVTGVMSNGADQLEVTKIDGLQNLVVWMGRQQLAHPDWPGAHATISWDLNKNCREERVFKGSSVVAKGEPIHFEVPKHSRKQEQYQEEQGETKQIQKRPAKKAVIKGAKTEVLARPLSGRPFADDVWVPINDLKAATEASVVGQLLIREGLGHGPDLEDFE